MDRNRICMRGSAMAVVIILLVLALWASTSRAEEPGLLLPDWRDAVGGDRELVLLSPSSSGPDTIYYDDGWPEWYLGSDDPGAGMAQRFTPDEPCSVIGFLWCQQYSSASIVHLWDDGGPDGDPGSDLVAPFEMNPGPPWHYQPLASPVAVSGDFYIGCIVLSSCMICFDNTDPDYNRAYFFNRVFWQKMEEFGYHGDFLVRAIVRYPGPPEPPDIVVSPDTLLFDFTRWSPGRKVGQSFEEVVRGAPGPPPVVKAIQEVVPRPPAQPLVEPLKGSAQDTIGYDDGSLEAWAGSRISGCGMAQRFAPSQPGMVIGFLWAQQTSATSTVHVWDSNGPDGDPGSDLTTPFDMTPGPPWYYRALPEPVFVDDDFYIGCVVIDSCFLGFDMTPPHANRAYYYNLDSWQTTQEFGYPGDYLLRAVVCYAEGVEGMMTIRNGGIGTLAVSSVTPSISWISWTYPSAFSVLPGDSQMVTVLVDTTGIPPGVYHGSAIISSNDPDEAVYREPVKLVLGTWAGGFVRGDVQSDGDHDIFDALHILNWLGGAADQPYCLDAADTDDDGSIDLFDGIQILSWLGGMGVPPAAPCCDVPGDCGMDPTPDDLDCEGFPSCSTPSRGLGDALSR